MTETNLRQADNIVRVEGFLSEKDLKVDVDNGNNVIKGKVVIKIDETNFVRFSVYVGEKTKNNESNPAYTGLVTVMKEYKSIAEVGEEQADRIRVTRGQLKPFLWNGKENMGYQATFFNRIKPEDTFSPKAEFEVEIFISNIVPEMARDGEDIEETGRLIVKGWFPTYNGIEPIELIADQDKADAIESLFAPGQTTKFYGDINNTKIEVVKEIPLVLGPPKVERTTTYKNELLITGAVAAYDEDSPIKPYDRDVIEAAKQERENKIKEKQASNNTPTSNARPSASRSGRNASFLI